MSHEEAPIVRRPARVALAVLAFVVLTGLAIAFAARTTRVRWARDTATPEVVRLVDDGNLVAAFRLLRQARWYLPDDPRLAQIERSYYLRTSVDTTPAGAEVFIQDPERPDSEWVLVGRTPVEDSLPEGSVRFRVTRPGHQTIEVVRQVETRLHFELAPSP